MYVLVEQRPTELITASLLVIRRFGRFPTHSDVDRQVIGGVEVVLHVSGKDRLAEVIGKRVTVGQAREAADQQVRQAVTGSSSVKCKLSVVLLVVDGIELVLAQIETN